MAAAEPPPLCRRIRDARLHIAGISQEEAARRLGLSLKGYRAYETFREPRLRRLRQIAAAFGLDDNSFVSELAPPRPFEERVEAELVRLHARLDRLEQLLAEGRTSRAGRR